MSLINLITIFSRISSEILSKELIVQDVVHGNNLRGAQENFRAFFGTTVQMCAILWKQLNDHSFLPERSHQHKHLLWALMFLKIYGTEHVMVKLAGCKSEKTFRKWTNVYIIALSNLTSSVVSSSAKNI